MSNSEIEIFVRIIFVLMCVGLCALSYRNRCIQQRRAAENVKGQVSSKQSSESQKTEFERILDDINQRPSYEWSRPEEVFFVMAELDMEVNNGGFDQFFFNTRNVWNDVLVASAREIKAEEVAQICEHALSLLDAGLPEDDYLERMTEECDCPFYATKDDIEELCVAYARDHISDFLFKSKYNSYD